jgi:hypothetical protein
MYRHLWHAVAPLVEAPWYKPEGRGFDSRWCHWNFYWHNSSGRTMALGLTQPLTGMSTRNTSWWGRGEAGRCVRLTLPSSSADCLEIWGPFQACTGIALPFTAISEITTGCEKMCGIFHVERYLKIHISVTSAHSCAVETTFGVKLVSWEV